MFRAAVEYDDRVARVGAAMGPREVAAGAVVLPRPSSRAIEAGGLGFTRGKGPSLRFTWVILVVGAHGLEPWTR